MKKLAPKSMGLAAILLSAIQCSTPQKRETYPLENGAVPQRPWEQIRSKDEGPAPSSVRERSMEHMRTQNPPAAVPPVLR